MEERGGGGRDNEETEGEERGREARQKGRRHGIGGNRGRQERSREPEGKGETRAEEREEEKEMQQRRNTGDEERRTMGVVSVTSPKAGGMDPLHLRVGLSQETEQEAAVGHLVGWAGDPSVAEGGSRDHCASRSE